MNLNDRGWGLGVFLAFVCLFVFCIIFSSISAYKAGLTKNSVPYFESSISTSSSGSTTDSSNNTKYKAFENKVLKAAMNYKRDKYNTISAGQTIVVQFSTLVKEKYLSDTEDCIGYVIIKNQNNDIQYYVYFKCSDYVSDGFDEKYISS